MDDLNLTSIAQGDQKVDSDEEFVDALTNLGGQEDEQKKDTSAESSTDNNQAADDPSQKGDDSAAEDTKGDEEEKSEAALAEKTAADDNTSDEKLEPFHTHPRWQKMQQEKEALAEQVGEMSKTLETLQSQGNNNSNTAVELPQWWVTLAGNED